MGDYNDAFMRNRDAAVQARTKAQNRATVLQLKLIGQSHPTGLTTNLLKLFEARPPLEHKPPPEKRKCLPYTGMAQFVTNFAEPGDAEYSPPVQEAETPTQKKARIHKLQLEKGATKAAEELQKYDPASDPNISGDPYKTLFVARLNYETTEHRIKREFEAYGPIKRVGISEHPQGERLRLLTFLNSVRMIADKVSNKPRGYAFIEYMHTRDMKAAYKQADGRKLDNKRVLVDVERGRTVPNWRPRRLGGGLGSTRVGGEEVNQRYSGREPQQIASGGPPRSEEPRAREDRVVDRVREKSRERGRDRELEREKSRERSHDRTRDRDSREERPHRDRDRTRDRDREKDRSRDRDRTRDRDRDRDRGRDYDRDRDRERDRDRGRDRPRERERDYERGETDHDRGHSRDRGSEHDRVESKHERNRHGEREREYDHVEPEHDHELYEEPGHGYGYVKKEPEDYEDHREHHQGLDTHVGPDRYDQKPERDYGRYVKMEPEDYEDHEHNQGLDTQSGPDRYDQDLERDYGRYIKTEPEDYQDDRADSESRQRERTRDQKRQYMRSERSLSREDEH